MKHTIIVKKEVELKTLRVDAGVRYWEDSTINGVEDDENGSLVPCKEGDCWCPIIDIETGVIRNWTQGVKAFIHYKVCDDGRYYVEDSEHNVIMSINGYVPEIMCPEGEGFGDYIIMHIDENGKIDKWKPTFKEFDYEEES